MRDEFISSTGSAAQDQPFSVTGYVQSVLLIRVAGRQVDIGFSIGGMQRPEVGGTIHLVTFRRLPAARDVHVRTVRAEEIVTREDGCAAPLEANK